MNDSIRAIDVLRRAATNVRANCSRANSVEGAIHGCHDCNELDKVITEMAELIEADKESDNEQNHIRNTTRSNTAAGIQSSRRTSDETGTPK